MKSYVYLFCLFLLFSSLFNCKFSSKKDINASLIFEDSGTKNWQDKWTLDGLKAEIINSDLGMEFKAGTAYGVDSCHAVLWTKKVFNGNFKMNYEYTRTDTVTRCVNILYLLATGKGTDEFPENIALWEDKRKEPKMSHYFNHMNAFHISYAAFAAKTYSGDNDYIRLRKYNPNEKGLTNTDIKPDYFKTGLFKPFVTYAINVIKKDSTILMNITDIKNPENKLSCKWNISNVDNLKSGRIGLRHMYTRSARYKNFKIWQLN